MLSEFITEVKTRGLANPNKFMVTIAQPKGIDFNNASDSLRLMRLFCDQTQLPDQNISTAQLRTYGEVREMPYENLYGNVNFSFYCDSNYIVKEFFDNWIQSISDRETRHWNYYDNYIAPNIDILTFNNDGRAVYGVKLYECYPKQMQAITMDYAAKETLKVNISMNYKYWRSSAIADSTQGSVLRDNDRFSTLGSDFSNMNGFTARSLSSQINSAFEIPNEYFNDFGGYQDQIFGDAQNIFTGAGDSVFADAQSLSEGVVEDFLGDFEF
jgi:hypothetical protein